MQINQIFDDRSVFCLFFVCGIGKKKVQYVKNIQKYEICSKKIQKYPKIHDQVFVNCKCPKLWTLSGHCLRHV